MAEPDVPADNNAAERSLRHLVISRKFGTGLLERSSFVIEFSRQAPNTRSIRRRNMEGKVQIEITYCVP